MTFRRLSLFWKIWLSTSVVLTVLFAFTGFVVQRRALEATSRSLEDEAQASFQAYVSLWRSRAEMLRSLASIISSLPNVRAAFGTRDAATIRDAAQELWARISDDLKEAAFFVVTDPDGNFVASIGEPSPAAVPKRWDLVRDVRSKFPAQVSGFFRSDGGLVQLVLTPVYVESGRGPALISVLISGYAVNHVVAQGLKEATGSDFVFTSEGRVVASTLNERATQVLASRVSGRAAAGPRVTDGVSEYVPLRRYLAGLDGNPVGTLWIFRSFEDARKRIGTLQRDLIVMWLVAISAGLLVSYLLARRIVRPVKKLDLAASEVARQNYEYRVGVESDDELGRLASTFNSMCESLQTARQELIRRERISTIGRLASSIVHDLRSPLAAIYGGAEMMVDTELSAPQTKRLASSIYRASRRIQELLQDLVNVSRGGTGVAEICELRDVVAAAVETVQPAPGPHPVDIRVEIPAGIELPLERARVERVFVNLLSNSIEAMPDGGRVVISARREEGATLVRVEDDGPGIPPEIRHKLFEPFVSFGKKNGLGLGLALSRQTVLDHGGDMWLGPAPDRGARFCIRLPLGKPAQQGAIPGEAMRPSDARTSGRLTP